MAKLKVPAAPSVGRLPSYLHVIKEADLEGYEFISGTLIAEKLQLESIQVRKDLAMTGIAGIPKRGYCVKKLILAIESFLGWNKVKKAILIGAGNLGTALSGYHGFKEHGLEIIAAFDNESAKIGTSIHGVRVFSIKSIAEKIKTLKPSMAILTMSSANAQEVTDILIKSGIKSIWNFTKEKLTVPDDVVVRKEDLTSGYAILCVMENIRKKRNK
ncbi:MAG: redox-sensing transcriptional repressor Rex [Treponema sp.]|nr:MAG: redox-sensing transcriptional repressor Rex [Treponema sp.]